MQHYKVTVNLITGIEVAHFRANTLKAVIICAKAKYGTYLLEIVLIEAELEGECVTLT